MAKNILLLPATMVDIDERVDRGVGLVFGTFEGYKTSHVSVEELERFAGLIIKECLDSSIAGIAKRFGVEL